MGGINPMLFNIFSLANCTDDSNWVDGIGVLNEEMFNLDQFLKHRVVLVNNHTMFEIKAGNLFEVLRVPIRTTIVTAICQNCECSLSVV